MSAVHFSDQDFKEKVIKSKLPVLVDFFAEWCGPCKMAAPIIDELAGEYKDKVVIGKVDVDQNQETAGKFGVMSIPTVIMFKNGKEVDRKTGFAGKAGYEEMLKKQL
ncbi:thioredoxin [Patescibacteria group bacterium]|nr:thioredoxin [Patescibacteria group bacterium]